MANLQMKEAALVYLDRSGGLQKFMGDCKYYNGTPAGALSGAFTRVSTRHYADGPVYIFTDSKQSYAVYRFNILINPCDVVELDAELGNHVLHHPLKAAQVFQSVSFSVSKWCLRCMEILVTCLLV